MDIKQLQKEHFINITEIKFTLEGKKWYPCAAGLSFSKESH